MTNNKLLLFSSIIVLSIACTSAPQATNDDSQAATGQSTSISNNTNRPRQKRREERQERRRDRTKVSTSSDIKEYEVKPETTDSQIDNWLEPHYVYLNPSVPAKNQLFVFFSGSFGNPSRQRLITQQAAKLGFHAINLRYPNDWTVGGLCRRSNDKDCFEKVRLEIVDGENRSDLVNISPANSIENRLVKLLIYLDKEYPDEGWSQYLDGNLPKWESIVVAGHSQGGGHAAIIAKEHKVARVVMLAAPTDFDRQTNAPGAWISKPHATPSDRYYGFVHLKDSLLPTVEKSWELLGMPGEVVNVDKEKTPYNNSHKLTSDATPATQGKYHGSVATDGNTPKMFDGEPAFKDVWQYLLE
jgi:hypothetical protein